LKVLKARTIVEGKARGKVVFSSQPLAFLRGVDPDLGHVSDPNHEIYRKSFAGRILLFPNSVGSSVGAYVIYRMKKAKKDPVAIINQKSDIITASGCAIAGIPLFDLPENKIEELRTANDIAVNSRRSEIRVL